MQFSTLYSPAFLFSVLAAARLAGALPLPQSPEYLSSCEPGITPASEVVHTPGSQTIPPTEYPSWPKQGEVPEIKGPKFGEPKLKPKDDRRPKIEKLKAEKPEQVKPHQVEEPKLGKDSAFKNLKIEKPKQYQKQQVEKQKLDKDLAFKKFTTEKLKQDRPPQFGEPEPGQNLEQQEVEKPKQEEELKGHSTFEQQEAEEPKEVKQLEPSQDPTVEEEEVKKLELNQGPTAEEEDVEKPIEDKAEEPKPDQYSTFGQQNIEDKLQQGSPPVEGPKLGEQKLQRPTVPESPSVPKFPPYITRRMPGGHTTKGPGTN